MKENIKLTTIGADIEVFVKNRKTGEIISAEGLIEGSKYEPHFFDPNDKFASTQLDNVLAEFTIAPAKKQSDFIAHLNKSIGYIKSVLPEGLDIAVVASSSLNDKYLQTEQAKMFGCEPDFNAYTMSINSKPYSEDPNLRSAGGHLHFGYEGIENEFKGSVYRYAVDEQRANIIRVLDLFIGIPSVKMEPDSKRKELYGKAGAFRPKRYGVEYRTVSNFYLKNNDLKKWVYNAGRNAFSFISQNGYLNNELSNLIQTTINNNDKDTADKLIKDFNLAVV